MDDERGPRLRREGVPRSRPTRRTVLAGAVAAIGLTAGCMDAGEDEESSVADPEPLEDESDAAANASDDAPDDPNGGANDSGGESDEAPDDSEASDGPALEHPSAINMAHSPVLGPEPTSGEPTVIMFDNPACPACAAFDESGFPELEAHADAGDLSIVWRGVPAIEPWADTALQVLWATYERDAEAFWELRAHVFEIQNAIDGDDDAVDRLTEHLEETTDLDVEAIRSEAEDGLHERQIALDEDAAAHAEIDATPYSFLFRDGEFRTEIRGAEDYRVFENALEL